MPRITKGSAEAKAWGERMKALRGGKKPTTAVAPTTEALPTAEEEIKPMAEEQPKKRAGRLSKGSAEAKEHMAKLRSMVKQK